MGTLVWVSGPYPAGKYTDIAIFNSILANCLEPGERVEADNGYVGRPDKIKCPNNDCNSGENRVMQGIARSRHGASSGMHTTTTSESTGRFSTRVPSSRSYQSQTESPCSKWSTVTSNKIINIITLHLFRHNTTGVSNYMCYCCISCQQL